MFYLYGMPAQISYQQGARIKQNSSADSIKMGLAVRDFALCM
jgi:hypothetical protein